MISSRRKSLRRRRSTRSRRTYRRSNRLINRANRQRAMRRFLTMRRRNNRKIAGPNVNISKIKQVDDDLSRFKIHISKIPMPKPNEEVMKWPWVFQSIRGIDKRVRVYDDKKDVAQALVKAVKDDYESFGFISWDKAQTGDTTFSENMAKYLKNPKYFDSGKQAYKYIVENYPSLSKNYRYLNKDKT